MATYRDKTYDAESYQAARPRYRDSFVDDLLAYHSEGSPAAGRGLAVDMATGTGIFARLLPPHFDRVVATDVSDTMLRSARAASDGADIEFVEAPAEDLSFLGTGTVDMMTVAVAAHWFDIERFVAEAARVLKPGGTLAIFGSTGFGHFVDYPQCDKMLKDFGLADDKVGSHWDKGRECLVNGYRDYHRALSQHGWTGIRRCISTRDIEGEAASGCPSVLVRGPAVVDFAVTWRTLQEYLQTWSALHRYHKEHPDRENLAKVVVREMMAASGATDMDEALSIEWEEIALMCHPPRTHADE